MAVVILGGLPSSLALNMVVLPALYRLYRERDVRVGVGDGAVLQDVMP